MVRQLDRRDYTPESDTCKLPPEINLLALDNCMNFADFYQIIQEAKFVPPTETRPIDQEDLFTLTMQLCKTAFGDLHVRNAGNNRIRLDFGGRHLWIDADPTTQLNFNKRVDIPSLYMSFDWEYDGSQPNASDMSYKDPNNDDDYLVYKTLQRDTMEAIHKLRDGVLRRLAGYSISIKYRPAGDRRSTLYAGILQSCGFREVKKNVWLPSSLYLPGVV